MEGQQRQDGRRDSSRSRKAEEYMNKVHIWLLQRDTTKEVTILLLASKTLRDPRIKSHYPTRLLLG